MLLLPMIAQAMDVRILGGKNRIVVKQASDKQEEATYQLKVAGKKYNFTLKGNQIYSVDGLAEKSYKVVVKKSQSSDGLNAEYKAVIPVFGEKYIATLPIVKAKDVYWDGELDELSILWDTSDKKVIPYMGAEIAYTNLRNMPSRLLLSGERTTVVTRDRKVTVCSGFVPEGCVDTLYTQPKTLEARIIGLEEKWSSLSLPETIRICVDDSLNGHPIIRSYATILLGKKESDPVTATTEHREKNVNELIGDYDSFYRHTILRVVNVLYTPGDKVVNIRHFTNQIGAMIKENEGFDGTTPAYMSQNNGKANMKINAPYLSNHLAKSNFEVLRGELTGIFLHEFTHAYQQFPRQTKAGHRPVAVEGVADAVRFVAKGFGDKERIAAGLQGEKSENKWLTPYRVSACFLMWLRNYDGDFVRKFHRTIKDMEFWSFDDAIHQILGEQYEAEQLWEAYLKDVKEEANSQL